VDEHWLRSPRRVHCWVSAQLTPRRLAGIGIGLLLGSNPAAARPALLVMDLLVTILIGIGAGTMVELLLPGHHASELVLAMLLGAAGALIARYAGERFGWYGIEEPIGFLASLLGAILILMIYGALFRRKPRGRR
jgi:uncharacterized membrane protein YeaQ/YmgE (transglycosylase-associated protein family)